MAAVRSSVSSAMASRSSLVKPCRSLRTVLKAFASARLGLERYEGPSRRLTATYAVARIAWPINVLPSDHMAPGTRSLAARTEANALTIQSQSASEMTNAGRSLIV